MVWQGKRTICEVLREIGDQCAELSTEIVAGEEGFYKSLEHVHEILYKTHEATVMAKKMSNKLREYRDDYDKNMWEQKIGEIKNG